MHLAGHNVDMTTTPTVLGLQGKRRRQTKQINPGIGTGERLNIAYPAYTYEHVQPGFAEYDLDEYDKLAADILQLLLGSYLSALTYFIRGNRTALHWGFCEDCFPLQETNNQIGKQNELVLLSISFFLRDCFHQSLC